MLRGRGAFLVVYSPDVVTEFFFLVLQRCCGASPRSSLRSLWNSGPRKESL